MVSTLNGDFQVRGHFSATAMTIANNAVKNASIEAGAGIAYSKVQQLNRVCEGQKSDTAATAEERVIGVVDGVSGSLLSFKVGAIVPATGDSTVTVDLHVNGSSVLTATAQLDSADAAYALVSGTINTAGLTADDVIEIVQTVSAGTGTLPQGVFWAVNYTEDPT